MASHDGTKTRRGEGRIGRRLLSLGILGAVATAFAFVIGLPTPATAQSVLDEVKSRGTLRVAGLTYRPLIMRKPSGEYYGADPEILEQFAKSLGVKLEFVNAGWDTAVAGITTGKWDLVPALCVTPKRQEAIDFSTTYLMLGGVLTVLKDNKKVNSLDDANKSSVTFANVAGGWGEQISKKAFPNATHKDFGQANDDQIATELLSGRADAAVFDTPVTISLLVDKHGDKFKFFPDKKKPMDVLPCPVAYGLKKGDTKWEKAVTDFIKQKQSSGELQKLFDKYMTAKFITEEKS
jgi:ABC-type amino acid transport substrate-binding protein